MTFNLKIKLKDELQNYVGVEFKFESSPNNIYLITGINSEEMKFMVYADQWITIETFLNYLKSGRIIILNNVSHKTKD